jgi:hypothetical protein
MFSTRPQAVQDRLEHQLENQAQNTTREIQRQIESQLETRIVDVHRQTIEGKGHEIQVHERAGASKQEVINQAHQSIMGSVDFELSKLKPPSLVSDKRGEIRDTIERAINETAERIHALQEETLAARSEAEKKLVQREREARLAEQAHNKSFLHSPIDLNTSLFSDR